MEAPPQSLHLPRVLTISVVLADAAAPAVHTPARASVMRAFRLRLRRPCPLLPPLRLRLLPSPPLPACRFLLAQALWALARLLAMPTRVLYPASALTTAPSFSVSVLPLLRLARALVLNGIAFLGGLASLGGPRHRQVHKRHRRQPRGHALFTRGIGHPSPGLRSSGSRTLGAAGEARCRALEAGGAEEARVALAAPRVAWATPLCPASMECPAADEGPQTTDDG
jgi:hypothetical protein